MSPHLAIRSATMRSASDRISNAAASPLKRTSSGIPPDPLCVGDLFQLGYKRRAWRFSCLLCFKCSCSQLSIVTHVSQDCICCPSCQLCHVIVWSWFSSFCLHIGIAQLSVTVPVCLTECVEVSGHFTHSP